MYFRKHGILLKKLFPCLGQFANRETVNTSQLCLFFHLRPIAIAIMQWKHFLLSDCSLLNTFTLTLVKTNYDHIAKIAGCFIWFCCFEFNCFYYRKLQNIIICLTICTIRRTWKVHLCQKSTYKIYCSIKINLKLSSKTKHLNYCPTGTAASSVPSMRIVMFAQRAKYYFPRL